MPTKAFVFGIATGLLLGLSFPPIPFFLLAFVCFIPIFHALKNARKRFSLLYLTFFIYHYSTNWWISSWQKDTDPYLFISGFAVALLHPFFFIIPFLPIFLLEKKLSYNKALVFFPFFWSTFEWLHSLGDLAYPWLSLGYTQAYNTLWIQVLDLGGVFLVSFLIVTINVLIFLAINELKIINKKFPLLDFFKNPKFVFAILLFIIPYIYGFVRINEFSIEEVYTNNKLLRVGVVQPNINPWRKWDTDAMNQIKINKQIQDSLLNKVADIDLFIWSETAITYLGLEINALHNFDEYQSWLEPKNFGLLTGFSDFKLLSSSAPRDFTTKFLYGDTNLPYQTYNSLLLLNPLPKMNYEIYHKIRLTPFGEHIPYSQVLGFAKKFLEWNVGISSWTKGKEQNLLKFQNHKKIAKIAPVICIESIFPNFVRNFVRKGSDLIVVVTNDGWYDHTFGPRQHFLIATFRAIENRRFVVRCANTGISGIISNTGQIIYEAPAYTRIGFAYDVPLLSSSTFYSSFGDWIAYLSFGLTLGSLLLGLISPRLCFGGVVG